MIFWITWWYKWGNNEKPLTSFTLHLDFDGVFLDWTSSPNMPMYVSSCAWNKGTRGKGIKDKGALQRQGSWLGWWNSIPRLIFDRHKILWNSYPRFQWEWVLLRVGHIRLCSLRELTFKNSLHVNCCIICCVYSDSVLCSVSQANRKGKEQLDGVSLLCCFVHQGLRSDWWHGSHVMPWSSKDRRERELRRRGVPAQLMVSKKEARPRVWGHQEKQNSSHRTSPPCLPQCWSKMQDLSAHAHFVFLFYKRFFNT